MAIVVSNGYGTFSGLTLSAAKWSKRRRLQALAAAQGATALVLFAVVGWGAMVGARMVGAHAPLSLSTTAAVSVGRGETLWSMARYYGIAGTSQLDRVDALARANGLAAGATLTPGERLLVPVDTPQEAARIEAQTAVASR